MKRRATYLFLSLIGVLVFTSLAVVVVLASEVGSRWLIHRMVNYAAEELTIKRIRGSILSGLILDEIDYRTDQQHVYVQRVELSLRPWALFGGTVHLRRLSIQGVTYAAPKTQITTERNPFQLPPDISFPLTVVIERATLNRMVFRRADTEHTLDYAYFAGRMDQNGLRLEKFKAEGEGFHVSLEGHTKLGRPYSFEANVNWNALLPNDAKAHGACDISGDMHALEFTFKLISPLPLETRGEIKLSRGFTEFIVTGVRKELRMPLAVDAVYGSEKGQNPANRKPGSYQAFPGIVFAAQNSTLTQIQTRDPGNPMNLEVENLKVHALGGMALVNGHIVWQSEPKWEFTANATDMNPSLLWPALPGKLAMDARLKGEINNGTTSVLLDDLKMSGQLLGQPFEAAGDFNFCDDRLVCENLSIRLGKNQFNINGTAARHLDLKFHMDAHDPASLWPGTKGHLRAKGILWGSFSNPAATISLEGRNMSYYGSAVRSLHAYFSIDSNDTQHSNALVKLVDLQAGDIVFPTVSLNWVGDFKDHSVSAEVVSPYVHANIDFSGRSHQDTWDVAFDRASFNLKEHGIWRLLNPVHLRLTHTEMKPLEACVVREKSKACMQSAWNDASGWTMDGDLNGPPMSCIIDLMKEFSQIYAAIQHKQ